MSMAKGEETPPRDDVSSSHLGKDILLLINFILDITYSTVFSIIILINNTWFTINIELFT